MTTQQETVEQFKGLFPAGSTIFPVVYWQDPSRPEIQRICFYAWHEGDHPRSITFITKYIARMLKHSLDTTNDACLYMDLGESATSIINQVGLVCYQDETAYQRLDPVQHLLTKIALPEILHPKLQQITSPTETAILTRTTWKHSSDNMTRTIKLFAMTRVGFVFELHDISILTAYALERGYQPNKGIIVLGTGYNHARELTKELAQFVWGDEDAFYQYDL